MIIRALVLVLVVTVSMGPLGKEGLSELTGLKILSGTYSYHKEAVVVIAVGRHQSGVRWKVFGFWHKGIPLVILIHTPQIEM